MIQKSIAILAVLALSSTLAHAVTLRTVIRDCGDDGKAFCPKSSYGKQMQQCLAQNYQKLTPACKVVMTKLKNGDSVTLF